MYRIRTVCGNPSCRAVFDAKFPEIGPLEGKTPERALALIKGIRKKRSITHKLGDKIRHSAGLEQDSAKIPELIECPECHSIFPISDLALFIYNAPPKQIPH